MDKVSISYSKVFSSIMSNDVTTIGAILDSFGFGNNDEPCLLVAQDVNLLQTILRLASAKAWLGKLSLEMADMLVKRISRTVNIYWFLEVLFITEDVTTAKRDLLPREICDAILNDSPCNESIANRISQLSYDEFRAMVSFLKQEPLEHDVRVDFNTPILSYILDNNVVTKDYLFIIMASSLLPPVEQRLIRAIRVITPGSEAECKHVGELEPKKKEDSAHHEDGCCHECGSCAGDCRGCGHCKHENHD